MSPAGVPVSRSIVQTMAGSIDVRALGLATGIVWGGMVTLLELTADTDWGERWRVLLEDLYPGYSRTPGDLVWGTTMGFFDGVLVGATFGWLYNWLES